MKGGVISGGKPSRVGRFVSTMCGGVGVRFNDIVANASVHDGPGIRIVPVHGTDIVPLTLGSNPAWWR